MSSGISSLPSAPVLPQRVLTEPSTGGVDTRLHTLVDSLVSAVGGAALIVDDTGRVIGHGCDGQPLPSAFTDAVMSKRLEPLQRCLRQPRTLTGATPGSGTGTGAPRLTSYQVLNDHGRGRHADADDPMAALEARIGSGSSTLGAVWYVAAASRCAAEHVRSVLRATAAFAGSAIATSRSPGQPDPADQAARLLLSGGAPRSALAPSGWQLTVIGLDLPAVPRPELPMALHALLETVRLQTVTPAEQLDAVVDGDRVYLLLQHPTHGSDRSHTTPAEQTRQVIGQLVAEATRRLGTAVRAGVGPVAADPADVPAARQIADEILDLPAGDSPCGHVEDLRAPLFLARLRRLAADLEFPVHDPLTVLTEWDRRRDTEYTRSLRVYLNHFGDASAAAEHLGVHVNTIRYRIKRAMTIAGMDLTDPDQRLALYLRLTCAPAVLGRGDA